MLHCQYYNYERKCLVFFSLLVFRYRNTLLTCSCLFFLIFIYLFIYLVVPALSCSMQLSCDMCDMCVLVLWIEPGPPALGVWSLCLWTTRDFHSSSIIQFFVTKSHLLLFSFWFLCLTPILFPIQSNKFDIYPYRVISYTFIFL